MARRKFSINASVFLTSVEYTSLPTIGQKGTFVPSSCDTAKAKAVFPVPGPPANSTARPDIFFALMRSTTTPQAYESQFDYTWVVDNTCCLLLGLLSARQSH